MKRSIAIAFLALVHRACDSEVERASMPAASAPSVATTGQLISACTSLNGPAIEIPGVEDGAVVHGPVTLTWSSSDPQASLTAKLDGDPVESGVTVASEGSHRLVVKAEDASGHKSSTTVRFTIDTVAPQIRVSGVAEAESYRRAVSPTYRATDSSAVLVSARLDGEAFASGDEVSAEGTHRLEVTATDEAGNEASMTVSFTVDLTPPAVSVTGVVEGQLGNQPVAPTFSVTDAQLESVTAKVDGESFTSGSQVAEEGEHKLVVKASDRAGNESSLTVRFTIDVTAPRIHLHGVEDAQVVSHAVSPTFSASDPHLGSVTATLDGEEHHSGASIGAEGDHELVVTASDQAGNVATERARFAIDLTAPAISISGVTEGQLGSQAVTISFAASDAHLESVVGKVDGEVLASGSQVSAEGTHTLVVKAKDVAGNQSQETVQFELDMTPPRITVTGVADGQVYTRAVTPRYSAHDKHLDPTTVTATLDGAAFASGTQVGIAGDHVLVVEARDTVGNVGRQEVAFRLEVEGPQITVSGVVDGQVGNQAVTPTFASSDPKASVEGTLNGAPFASGTTVTAEADHVLVVRAMARNGVASVATVRVAIDRTAPQIEGLGGLNGLLTNAGQVTPSFSAADVHPGSTSATLDGATFTSGTPVGDEGRYVLVVTATDLAGNFASQTATFTIDRTAPQIEIAGVSEGLVTRAAEVNPSFSVSEEHPGSVEATLNAVVFTSGAPVVLEGEYVLVVSATDGAGNASTRTVRFAIDRTAPEIQVAGVTHGQVGKTPVTARYTVSDAHPDATTATLDGAPFTSGATVSAPGEHTLVVSATDLAGNSRTVTVGFTIDTTAPQIEIAGVVDGQIGNTTVTPTFTVTEAHPGNTTATLDNEPYTSGTPVSAAGEHLLTVSATDAAGNGRTVSVSFTIDVTPPQIAIHPELEGLSTNAAQVVPTFTATDAHPDEVKATLNGEEYESGTAVNAERTHVLVVTARDLAGNSASETATFTIDRTLPQISVAGVAQGQVSNAALVSATYGASDEHLAGVSAKLNGFDYASGEGITEEGEYELVVRALDEAGNEAVESVSFAIDRTSPVIEIAGVIEGEVGKPPLTATFSATDGHLKSVKAKLDGQDYESGTAVTAEGDHTLLVTAEDYGGNTASKSVAFSIDATGPSITIGGVADGERRNSPATITFAATDPHLQSVTGKLDGASIESGAVVSEAGAHVVEVVASDSVGNEAQASRSFFIDTLVPTVAIESPADGTKTTAGTVEIVVSASDDGPMGTVSVGATTLIKGGDGKYRGSVTLSEGTNVLEVVAFDAAGNSARATVSVVRDSTAPQVVIATPEEGTRLTALSVSVTGTVTDATAVTLTVNGTAVAVQGDGSFSATVSLSTGLNTIAAVATDAVGNSGQATRSVRANSTAPVLAIAEPADGATTISETILLRGTATPGDASDAVTVTVDGMSVGVSTQGEFQAFVTLAEGPKTLVVVATDGYGLKTERSLTVTRTIPADAGEAGADAATPPGMDAAKQAGPDGGAVAGPDAAQPGVDAGMTAGPDASSAKPDTGVPQEAAPTLMVSAPSEGAVLGSQSVGVSGQVQAGTLPVTVKVNGASATVSGRYFSAALALAEGEHSLGIEVTDAQGRTASAQRSISVDRTAPYLAIEVPGTNPAAVTTSPFRIEGAVGDAHLGGVTVNGEPAFVLAGRFSASVALSAGDNAVLVEATDLAGNRQTVTQHLTIEAVAPTVVFLEPYDGTEATEAVQRVRVQVSGPAAISSVHIGAGSATEVGGGTWEAHVALALGENTIGASATDVNGLTGTASITVRYRDPSTEPLAVAGVQPENGATEIQPSALISVSFNKAIEPQGIESKFTVLAKGAVLPGEYLVARGAQIVTFAANEPLPEGETLTVRVYGVGAAEGPGQASDFVSQLTVRRSLTIVRGLVLDDGLRPAAGVRVELAVTQQSALTDTEGNWAIVSKASGPTVIKYEGGTTAEGKALPTVRRKIYVTAETTNAQGKVVLTPTDGASAQYVDGAQATAIDFRGLHGALAVGMPANGLVFPDGNMAGYVTATEIAPYVLPVPIEGRAMPMQVWQLGPAGTRVMQPVQLSFPNPTQAPAGRLALLLAYDDSVQAMARVGFGRVRVDGSGIDSLASVPVKSIEYLGYMPLTAEQSQVVDAALGTPGSGVSPLDGGAGFFERERRRWKRALEAPLDLLLMPFEGTAHAQILGAFTALAAWEASIQNSVPAAVIGHVHGPLERVVRLDAKSPSAFPNTQSAYADGTSETFTFEASLDPLAGVVAQDITVELTARLPDGALVPLATQVGISPVTVVGMVALKFGKTTITCTASTKSDKRVVELEALLVPDPTDAGAATTGALTILKVADTSVSGQEPFQEFGTFKN
ncbi:MAG: Ig-like domain-containing protein, partial [Deltaproteobacteria bacterium]|nr:Ig-like domain-containing protein [Deltaproteobacteria bacterium]